MSSSACIWRGKSFLIPSLSLSLTCGYQLLSSSLFPLSQFVTQSSFLRLGAVSEINDLGLSPCYYTIAQTAQTRPRLLFAYLLGHAGVYHVTILKHSEACRKHSAPAPTPFGPLDGFQRCLVHMGRTSGCRVAVPLFTTVWRLNTIVFYMQWTV